MDSRQFCKKHQLQSDYNPFYLYNVFNSRLIFICEGGSQTLEVFAANAELIYMATGWRKATSFLIDRVGNAALPIKTGVVILIHSSLVIYANQ